VRGCPRPEEQTEEMEGVGVSPACRLSLPGKRRRRPPPADRPQKLGDSPANILINQGGYGHTTRAPPGVSLNLPGAEVEAGAALRPRQAGRDRESVCLCAAALRPRQAGRGCAPLRMLVPVGGPGRVGEGRDGPEQVPEPGEGRQDGGLDEDVA
jgi:hypothetical protein